MRRNMVHRALQETIRVDTICVVVEREFRGRRLIAVTAIQWVREGRMGRIPRRTHDARKCVRWRGEGHAISIRSFIVKLREGAEGCVPYQPAKSAIFCMY
jgi:hypothetical protein